MKAIRSSCITTCSADTAEWTTKARYRAGKVGDVEVKDKLARALNAALEPMRARRAELLANTGRIEEILAEGSRRAGQVAGQTMERVRDAMKISYKRTSTTRQPR